MMADYGSFAPQFMPQFPWYSQIKQTPPMCILTVLQNICRMPQSILYMINIEVLCFYSPSVFTDRETVSSGK